MKTNKCSKHMFAIIRTYNYLKSSIKSRFCQSALLLSGI
nr:MAG TPA: hypothetical protein [Caudoviricetes sp.]